MIDYLEDKDNRKSNEKQKHKEMKKITDEAFGKSEVKW